MIDAKSRVFDGSVAMRRFLLAAVMFGVAAGAQAADLPDFLRGSLGAAPPMWQGFYLGGQAGYGSSDENFSGANTNMTQALLANTLIESAMGVAEWNLGLGKESAQSSGYGGFAGYNSQWNDVVLGLEMSYLHGNFGGQTSATESRSSTSALADGNFHDVTATSSASIAISDMATFRGRAAYSFGSFLPYVFGGFALGNADITRSINVQDVVSATQFGPGIPLAPLNTTDVMSNHLIYGYTAGVGIDINLTAGLFMRAEWEYIRFTDQIDTSINTVRAGLGYKF
jgi:outer membrane immunogenic protein